MKAGGEQEFDGISLLDTFLSFGLPNTCWELVLPDKTSKKLGLLCGNRSGHEFLSSVDFHCSGLGERKSRLRIPIHLSEGMSKPRGLIGTLHHGATVARQNLARARLRGPRDGLQARILAQFLDAVAGHHLPHGLQQHPVQGTLQGAMKHNKPNETTHTFVHPRRGSLIWVLL